MKQINSIPGLKFQKILPRAFSKKILQLEDTNNTGVLSCLKKNKVLVLSHNSAFRDPLVKNKDGSFNFSPQPFPEFSSSAIMASPSKGVHELLVKACKLPLKEDEATLLVGMD